MILGGCLHNSTREPTVIVQKEPVYITQAPLRCPVPTIDSANLRPYEFKVLPSLRVWGVTEAQIDDLYEKGGTSADYRYLKDFLDNSWWAVDPFDFQDIDLNDIDKLQALKQSTTLVGVLLECISHYNEDLKNRVPKPEDATEPQ